MRHSSLLYFSLFILHSSILLFLISCSDKKRDAIGQTEVLIETSEGDIVVRLYDDTPVHRDNFIRNAEAGIYDGLLFNRIVPEMVIQSGDTALKAQPLSKGNGETAAEDATGQESLPSRGDLEGSSEGSSEGAALPPEIIYPRHFHKQGALAAAREPDSINPGRRSSPLQWYIVTGKKQTSAELSELTALLYEAKVAARFEQLQREHAAELERLRTSDRAAQQDLYSRLQIEAENYVAKNPPAPFTDLQRQTYARIGGAPHLDGEYTVFGEVVEGMPIALRIGRTPVDARERPRRAVYVKRITVKRKK
ncbi:MAG: peptidylprolyl isomerase [Bacteroidaceae bacterium]|nr:peptidylprolyl isomerase [Bacteroidaceae bacterium]